MRGGLGRRGRVALAAGLPLLALGAAAAVVVAGGASGDGGSPAAGARGRGGTRPVERRTLVDRATLDGTLGYGATAPAMDRLGGTITWLPAPGATIRPGRRLFAVDGEPVILMDGRVPAWRTLAAGVADGADVEQLERNLAALGYDPGTVDESFTSATAAAVSRWQRAAGLTRTGRVELGRVVFLPGERRVASVDATLGSAAGGGSGNAPAAWESGGARYAYASYETGAAATTPTTPTTPTPTTPTTPATTPTTPATTPRTTPTTPTTPSDAGGGKPAKGDASSHGKQPSGSGEPSGGGSPASDGGGDGGGSDSAATKVLTTTSTARVVTAQLDVSDEQLARIGVRAVVTLPGGRRVGGRIVRVGTVASSSGEDGQGGAGGDGGSDGGGETTLPLTIRLRSTRAAGRLDAAPVSVELARETRRDVLAVPVEALLARAGGGYAVRVRRASGAVATVPVQPGLFADGYVELTGGAVRAGDRVEVPR